MRTGIARWNVPIQHFSYIFPQRNGNQYSHHESRQTKPGAWWCGICGRWVVRGMGRWWGKADA